MRWYNSKKFLILLFTVAISIVVSGCCRRLSVQTQYVSEEDLASYIVNTPDPLLKNPPLGQKIIISWSLPPRYLNMNDLHLQLTVRFKTNHEIQTIVVPIKKRSDTYVYSLLNEEYIQAKGIETYKVNIVANGQVIEKWRHQLWVELISLKSE